MRDLLREATDQLIRAQAAATDAVLNEIIKGHGRSVIAHPDQRIDPLWLGDRDLVRNPVIPLGTAIEYDPRVLDFYPGIGLA